MDWPHHIPHRLDTLRLCGHFHHIHCHYSLFTGIHHTSVAAKVHSSGRAGSSHHMWSSHGDLHVFYIPEYVAFMAYAAVFTFFFTFHPYYEWAPDVEVAEQAELLDLNPEAYTTTYYDDYNHQNTTTPLILGERYQNTKRYQEAKVSYFYFPPLPPLLYPTGPYNA